MISNNQSMKISDNPTVLDYLSQQEARENQQKIEYEKLKQTHQETIVNLEKINKEELHDQALTSYIQKIKAGYQGKYALNMRADFERLNKELHHLEVLTKMAKITPQQTLDNLSKSP